MNCEMLFINLDPDTFEITIFCFHYKHLSFSNKPYQPEINFIKNKYQAL